MSTVSGFPFASVAGAIGSVWKSLIDEIQRAVGQRGPGNRQNGVDESAEFQGSRGLSLTRTHKGESGEPTSVDGTASG